MKFLYADSIDTVDPHYDFLEERSKPKRGFLVIICMILGLVLSTSFVLLKETLINLIKEIND